MFLFSADGWPIASSVSTIDNVEHLFVEALPPGRYDLQVFKRRNDIVSAAEDYALAFSFAPARLTGAVSRKLHAGSAFDVPLPLAGAPGVECRTGGGSNQHQIVFSFAVPVTFIKAAVSSGTGSVASTSGSGTNVVTVHLTGVANQQTITVALFGVNDGQNIADVGVKMGVLAGDTNSDSPVNVSDTNQTKAHSGQLTSQTNFRTDVNLDGRINVSDATFVKDNAGTSL